MNNIKTALMTVFLVVAVMTGIAGALPTVKVAYTVSEPTSMVLFGFGLIGLAELKRKRNGKDK